MLKDVFLSHSSADKETARALCDGLESADLTCWIAPRDITAGVPWARAITEGIDAARIVLVLLSPASNESEPVHNEVTLAGSRGKHLLPVRLEELALCGALEFHLSGKHWFNAFPPPAETHLPRLVEHVRSLLGKPPEKGAADAAAVGPTHSEPAAITHQPLALVVDDDEEVRLQVKSELAKEGLAAVLAEDGSRALARLRELSGPPDVVVLDMEMPGIDGVNFLDQFRSDARNAAVPVVVLTSKSGGGWKKLSSSMGADAFLSKPLLGKELRACVRGFLGAGRP